MTGEPKHEAMVMLASAQLWPNLHGLVHWHQLENGGPLRHVCICHTADRAVSQEPAERLKQFCHVYDPQIEVHLPESPCEATARGVREQLARWRSELPAEAWIINATGGNKLMFAGATEFARQDGVEVVYREFGKAGWYRLSFDQHQLQTQKLSVPESETDAVPVEWLCGSPRD